MNRMVCCLLAVVLLALVAPAWAADDQPEPMQPVVENKPIADEKPADTATKPPAERPAEPAAAEQAKETAPSRPVAVESPRRTRWQPMKVEYLMANTHHPPLAFDSVQEKLKYDDAKMRSPGGKLVAAAYEVAQFPAQLALCPVYLVTKPVWRRDRAEP
ncbi:MAG: hypothetical protein JXL80_07030 [Planctomycetes bacterium]|nr:hypothetical protein [Planctomycetota bacterium]